MLKISFEDVEKNIDKYFDIVGKGGIVNVEIEKGETIVLISEQEYKKIKGREC